MSRSCISPGRILWRNVRLGYSGSGINRGNNKLLCVDVMVVGLDFFLHGVKQEPGCGVINLSIDITNFVGYLTRNFVRHDANNNLNYSYAFQRDINNILARGRDRGIWGCGGGGGVVPLVQR